MYGRDSTVERKEHMRLQVLVRKTLSDKHWFVVGLEHCVAGQGESMLAALNAFLVDLAQQIILDRAAGCEPLSETPPADAEFWEQYQKSPLRLILDVPMPEPARDWVPDIRVAA